MKKKIEKKKIGFSYSPETIGRGKQGEFTVIDSNHYLVLTNVSLGSIAYTPKDNKYWVAEQKEMSEKVLKEKYLRYIRWDFDQMEDEIINNPDPNAKNKLLKTGYQISKNPPTPENIAKQRKILMDEAIAAGNEVDSNAILNATRPTQLVETEKFLAILDQATPMEQMARKLNKYTR
jgi:hypothetical protein